MKTLNLLRRLPTAALALACIFPVQAANYEKLVGSNMDFYYDTDTYGVDGLSVNGNTLDIPLHFSYPTGSFERSFDGLIVVPHAGFSVSVAPTMVMSGTYETARFGGGEGGAYALVAHNAMFGTFADGKFVVRPEADDLTRVTVAVNAMNLYNGQSGVQEYTLSDAKGASWRDPWYGDDDLPQWSTSALSYAMYFSIFDGGQNGGINVITSATATSGKWIFDAQAISVVPEPGSVMMSLAGLALIGFVLRRRQV